jgi:signal peptidase I
LAAAADRARRRRRRGALAVVATLTTLKNPVHRLTERLPRPLGVAIDWLLTIGAAVAIVLAIKAWVVNPYRIPSSSMEPTLHCARPTTGCEAGFSDRVLANRFLHRFSKPDRGDIFVFEATEEIRARCNQGGTFVKRIVGLPGETITIDGTGSVLIDGRALDESEYLDATRQGGHFGSWQVADDEYFLLGDNRRMSCDSRSWGPLPKESLVGEVFAIYWPPDRIDLAAALVGLTLIQLGLRAGRPRS